MREAAFRIRCVPEQRSRISSNQYRIPDICLLDAAAPKEQVVETPPVLCIEILFREDSLQYLQVRVDDYLSIGVPEVWLIDPQMRRGWRYTNEGAREAENSLPRTLGGRIGLPFADHCAQI